MTRGFHSAMQKAGRLASETAKKEALNSPPSHFKTLVLDLTLNSPPSHFKTLFLDLTLNSPPSHFKTLFLDLYI